MKTEMPILEAMLFMQSFWNRNNGKVVSGNAIVNAMRACGQEWVGVVNPQLNYECSVVQDSVTITELPNYQKERSEV